MGDAAPLLASPLRPGDRIAVVAPSGPLVRDLGPGLEVLRSWGFEPVVGDHVHDVAGHLAGVDRDRAADIDAAFREPSIRAVWAARGGFGATRIRSALDWDGLRADPVPLLGFSDVTALHHAAWRRLRLVTFHAPHVGRLASLEDTAARHLRRLVTEPVATRALPASGRTVAGGMAEGPLLGGNLALVCAGLGTPDELDPTGAVLLLEDVGEPPYRIDRCLTQLREAGLLERVAAVAVGTFVDCDPPEERPSASVERVLEEHLADLGVPVVADLPLGHTDDQLAVPHGARVHVDADTGRLEVTSAALVGSA